jgi:ABC-type transport system involved in multi-copper enzyme maturation permease subunit
MNNAFAVAGVVIKEMYRRKDFYVLFIMTALITLMLGSVHLFNDDRIVRYLKEICLLLIWISTLVMAITTAARQIPTERESRTIFPLLAKPVSRSELICGKFLGCWQACGLALLVFYLFFTVISTSREHEWMLLNYFQALWLHWICLGVVTAMVLLGSIVLTAPSSNITISFISVLGILFLGGHLNKVAVSMGGGSGSVLYAIYYAIPHLEWYYDVKELVIHNRGMVDWTAWIGATVYGVLYGCLLLGVACVMFRRKTLA